MKPKHKLTELSIKQAIKKANSSTRTIKISDGGELSKDLCNRQRNTDATNTSLHVDITGFDSATYFATVLQQ